jgi:hypothetical protein
MSMFFDPAPNRGKARACETKAAGRGPPPAHFSLLC